MGYDFFISNFNDKFYLECNTNEQKELANKLVMYKLRLDIQITVNSDLSVILTKRKLNFLESNSSNIIKVLPKSEGPITEAHFVYPQSLKNTARVQAFRNFLFSKIGDWQS